MRFEIECNKSVRGSFTHDSFKRNIKICYIQWEYRGSDGKGVAPNQHEYIFYFCGVHPVALYYHTFQIYLQSQLNAEC
jgi:hypothetical protein